MLVLLVPLFAILWISIFLAAIAAIETERGHDEHDNPDAIGSRSEHDSHRN